MAYVAHAGVGAEGDGDASVVVGDTGGTTGTMVDTALRIKTNDM